MTNEMIFAYANWTALAGWAILVLAPRRVRPLFWTAKYYIPAALAGLYTTLLIVNWGAHDGDFNSLAGVSRIFDNDRAVLVGWVHYLAFDLFIGAWIAERADEARISRLIQPVFFFFTLMAGPLGLLLFLVARSVISSRTASAS